MQRLALVVAFAVCASPVFAQSAPTAPRPQIVSVGEGVVKRAPDRAWLTVATETRDVRAAEARRLNAQLMTQVQAALRGTGLAADALRTTGYSLTPDMEWTNGRSVMRGYIVRNQIEVRVDDLARLGEVIDAANVPKGTGLSIVGPRFGLKDEKGAENEALRLAVQAAVARAESMAAGARRSVGDIIRIEEQGVMRPGPEPMMVRAVAARPDMAVETPVSPGDIEIQAHVTLTIELR